MQYLDARYHWLREAAVRGTFENHTFGSLFHDGNGGGRSHETVQRRGTLARAVGSAANGGMVVMAVGGHTGEEVEWSLRMMTLVVMAQRPALMPVGQRETLVPKLAMAMAMVPSLELVVLVVLMLVEQE
jgi:hypothetical protein